MKKKYWLFTIVDRYHLEDTVRIYCYGTIHEMTQYKWLLMKKVAKDMGRKFNPMDEFKPYDWNSNGVYCVHINSWDEDPKFRTHINWIDCEEEIA